MRNLLLQPSPFDVSGLDQSCGDKKQWVNVEYTLKVKSTGIDDR